MMGGGGTRDGSLGRSPADVRHHVIAPDAVGARGGRGVGLHLQLLRGPGLGLVEQRVAHRLGQWDPMRGEARYEDGRVRHPGFIGMGGQNTRS